MKKKELFDQKIKEAIIDAQGNQYDKDMFGYCLLPNNDRESHVFERYYSNNKFAEFCQKMKKEKPAIYKSYALGKGSELIPNGNPPKMASVASSSRFCYISLRDASIHDFDATENNKGKKFEFEKELPIKYITGTYPQMDAFIETDRAAYFFEFKCHEIFDSHDKELSNSYDKEYLNKWGIVRETKTIPSRAFGLEKKGLFDLKQFITHVIGIINYQPKCDKPKILSYVYFKPKNVDKELFDYEKLKSEIQKVFGSDTVNNICEENKIELRLYYYENNIMDGFEKEKKPRREL